MPSILINILILICSLATAIYAVFGSTTDTTGKLNRRGYSVLVIAALAFIFSSIKECNDDKESKEKDIKIENLNRKIDSLNFTISNIDTNILNQKTRLFADKISLQAGDTSPIMFPLNKDMSIKILKQNCDNAIVLYYNNKPRRISDTDEEFSLKENANCRSFFENQNDVPCGIDFEIWGSLASFRDANNVNISNSPEDKSTSIISENQNETPQLTPSSPKNQCGSQVERVENGWALQLCSSNKCETVLDTKSFLERIISHKLVMFKSKKDNLYRLAFGQFASRDEANKYKPVLIEKINKDYPESKGVFAIEYAVHK